MTDDASLESCAEILDRVQPALEAIFSAYRVPEERAREILEAACQIFVSLRLRALPDPAGWLVRTVIEMCRSDYEEGTGEDPSE